MIADSNSSIGANSVPFEPGTLMERGLTISCLRQIAHYHKLYILQIRFDLDNF